MHGMAELPAPTASAAMNTVSLVGSVSRQAGGLFESVRHLDQALLESSNGAINERGSVLPERVEVAVLGLRDVFTGVDLAAWHPVPVCTFNVSGPSAFGYSRELSTTLRRMRPDLVHVHGLWQYTSIAALKWHRRSRKPYLVSPHGMLDPWALTHSRWKKRLGWWAYERSHLRTAACIRALCGAEAEAIRTLGLSNPVCVIPNGIDLPGDGSKQQQFPTSNSNASGPNSLSLLPSVTHLDSVMKSLGGRKVLLYLGRIHPKKGLVPLLRAWAEARPTSSWLMVIAGWDQGGHEAALKRLVFDLRLKWTDTVALPSDSVLFAGPQFGAPKAQWLERCDAFILPSLSEGLPMAILEAWAYAKPVLLTRQCHLPEGLSAGAAIGLETTSDGMQRGLKQLLGSPDLLLKAMGARGRNLVASRFAWAKVAEDLTSVYQWLLGSGPRPDCVMCS
jgi:glycosyltransferase involved in cell wall biosynthesis